MQEEEKQFPISSASRYYYYYYYCLVKQNLVGQYFDIGFYLFIYLFKGNINIGHYWSTLHLHFLLDYTINNPDEDCRGKYLLFIL